MIGPRVAWLALAATAIALAAAVALGARSAPQTPTGAAWFVRSFETASDRRESRPDVLDAPMLPGSVMKAFTLAAALESHTIEAETTRLCRRVVTIEGRRYACSHPDLKRALTPAEALAHSCNDFFVSLAPRLPRAMVNDVRARVGLPPIAANANYAAALVGLDGPRVSPRVLLDVFARLAGVDRDRAIQLSDTTRRVLAEGLRGAAAYGSASELGARKISALAKTGTAPMPGGGFVGVLVALTPADNPTRGVVVVAPGAAGRDASSIAADLLAERGQTPTPDNRRGQTPTRDNGRGQPPTPDTGPPGAGAQSVAVRVGITSSAGKIHVEHLPLEAYVARVLAGEGQPRAAAAAQQALAIAIRTFALANRNRHRREGFDLCDTTHCQVLRTATATTRRAAEETAGRVLVHQNQPATIFYSAWCGGRTELASQVWPGAIDYAFEPAQEDEACRDEPGWTAEIDVREIERALRLAGLRGDRLRDLRIISRTASGRVSRLRAEGFTPAEVTGDDFRMAIGRVAGWQHVKSTMFEMRRISNGYVFIGRGFGHGVGMCVVGAGARAARGRSADEILRFYYPGLRVQPYTAAALTTSVPKPATPAAPATRAAADVLVALPAGEESERTTIMQMVRRARDDIAGTAGVKPPPAIRVTVHPNVESFGRATGQPWWVSGSTDQSAIDLLPLTVLQQRGQFERTIRHEVAHVLIDSVLNSRRMWVREGAALYFSNPASAAERPSRTRCPEDAEFLRPISAGAHRDAYARAEACFRRQVMEGKDWRDVK